MMKTKPKTLTRAHLNQLAAQYGIPVDDLWSALAGCPDRTEEPSVTDVTIAAGPPDPEPESGTTTGTDLPGQGVLEAVWPPIAVGPPEPPVAATKMLRMAVRKIGEAHDGTPCCQATLRCDHGERTVTLCSRVSCCEGKHDMTKAVIEAAEDHHEHMRCWCIRALTTLTDSALPTFRLGRLEEVRYEFAVTGPNTKPRGLDFDEFLRPSAAKYKRRRAKSA